MERADPLVRGHDYHLPDSRRLGCRPGDHPLLEVGFVRHCPQLLRVMHTTGCCLPYHEEGTSLIRLGRTQLWDLVRGGGKVPLPLIPCNVHYPPLHLSAWQFFFVLVPAVLIFVPHAQILKPVKPLYSTLEIL